MKAIKPLADRLTCRYGTSSPVELCDRLRIDIYRFDLPKRVEGLSFQTREGKLIILLNRSLGESESRYCCAHELGHALLHPGLNAQAMADLTNLCVPRLEREADLFAACLLIDPSLEEWSRSYEPLTAELIACLSGLPRRVVDLWCGSAERVRLDAFGER